MGDTKEKMKRACPTLKDLADKLEKAVTLINELRTDYNAHVAAVTAKLNTVNERLEEVATEFPTFTGKINAIVERVEDVATQYTAHLAGTHPDVTNVLTETAVVVLEKVTLAKPAATEISESDNLISSEELEVL